MFYHLTKKPQFLSLTTVSVTFIFLIRIILSYSIERSTTFFEICTVIKYFPHKTDSGLKSRGVKFLCQIMP